MKERDYILWLPSWYPNAMEPYYGDFIQRHARAAALNNNITVIFFTQYGEAVTVRPKVYTTEAGNLKEVIVYVPFKPWGYGLVDRIRYNLHFYYFCKKFLKEYFNENGLPSVVHVHVPVKSGNLALWIKMKFGISFIVSEQASTYLKQAPDNFFNRHWLYRLQVKKIFSRATKVTNVSSAVGEILKQLFQIKDFRVIHNVVDTEIFRPSFLRNEVFTYIHVSSLTDQKNILGILRVFKNLASIRTDWKLILVGPPKKEIEDYIMKEQLNHLIELTGEVPYTEVAVYMKQSHVLVLFSKHENFPCVVVEALCCGLPVISSDVAGIKEAINSSNGILVESEDEEALLLALLEIKRTYDVYDAVSIASDAEKNYSFPAIAEKFDDLYRRKMTV